MRSKKLKFYDFVDMFNYYGFHPARVNIRGVRYFGNIYYVDNATPEKMEKLKEYSNIAIFKAQSAYAPEQKKQLVFIGQRKSRTSIPEVCAP